MPARGVASIALALLASLALGSAPAWADAAAFKKDWGQASRLQGDAKRDAQVAALKAIGPSDDVKLAKLLPGLATDRGLDYAVRDAVEDALAGLKGPEVEAWFKEALGVGGKKPREKKAERRVVLCYVLGRRAAEDAAVRELLFAGLNDPDDLVALAALRGLRSLELKDVVAALVARLPSASGRLAADCKAALTRLTGESFATPAEWTSFWEAKGGAWAPGAKRESQQDGEDVAGARSGTRTRLDPPKGGQTIYGTVTSSKVLFVVDVSGSMQVRAEDTEGRTRSRLDYVRESLQGVIDAQLDEGDRFNVLVFSSKARFLSKKGLLKGSASNKKKARSWIRALQPEEGTNVYLALEQAFSLPEIDTIYFLSDGSPSEGTSIVTDEILGQTRVWNSGRGVRIHAIGFLAGEGKNLGIVQDKGMAKRFLEALAKDNDGSARFFE